MEAGIQISAITRRAMGVASSARASPRLSTSLAVAGLHLAALGALCVVFHASPPTPPAPELTIPVVFAPPAMPTAPATLLALATATLPVPTLQEPASLAPVPPSTLEAAMASPAPRHLLRPMHHTPTSPPRQTDAPHLPSTAVASATAAFPSPPGREGAPARTPSADAETAQAQSTWEGRVRQAVQDATIYPASARLLHREGRAQVRFDYDHGSVEAASIAQTSHSGALDNAALAAVTHAAIPAPPAELGKQKRPLLVSVVFSLSTEE